MRSRDKKEEICCVCHEEYKSKQEPVQPQPTQIAQKEADSDEEYQKMAKEYEQTRGIKLPPRNKGSGGRGFARKPMEPNAAVQEEPE